MTNRRPNLPDWSGGNNPDPNNQIVWVESDDVYKPIPKSRHEFNQERGIQNNSFSLVYIQENALNILKHHLGSNLRVEQGGILFGNAYQEPNSGQIYVEIKVAVPAPATIGTGAHLEFTSDSWLGIIDYARRSHPQENIVGWYHSHPNLGVFMSGTDMNTQRSFFNHPWCLSIVHDPVRNTIGYFLGIDATQINSPVIVKEKTITSPYPDINYGENTETEPAQISTTSSRLIAPNPGNNTSLSGQQTPQSTQITPEQTEQNKKQKEPKLPLQNLPLLVGGVIFIIIIVSLMLPKLFKISETEPLYKPTSITRSNSDVKYETKTIPTAVWKYLDSQDGSSLLRYKVITIDQEKKNLNGDKITVITIASPQVNAKISDVKLKVDKLTINQEKLKENKLKLDDFKPLETSKEDLDKYGDLEEESKPIKIDFDNKKEGVIIALYSVKNTPSQPQNQPPKSNNQRTSASQTPQEIIYYIPRKIIYQDSKQQPQEIEMNKILK